MSHQHRQKTHPGNCNVSILQYYWPATLTATEKTITEKWPTTGKILSRETAAPLAWRKEEVTKETSEGNKKTTGVPPFLCREGSTMCPSKLPTCSGKKTCGDKTTHKSQPHKFKHSHKCLLMHWQAAKFFFAFL